MIDAKTAKEQSSAGEKAARAILLNLVEGGVSESIKIGKCSVSVEVPNRLDHVRQWVVDFLTNLGYEVKQPFSNQDLKISW